MIHDLVFAAGMVLFNLALVPMIMDRRAAVPLRSSLLTGVVQLVFIINYLTMGLWWSALAAAVNSSFWLFVAAFRRPVFGSAGEVCPPEPAVSRHGGT